MTRAETIRIDLTEQILGGARQPGTPLDELELARCYGTSRTPVREALRRLASSGLVTYRPHHGAVVAAPSEPMLGDMFQVMADLEGLCAGHAARRMSTTERNHFSDFHDRMAAIVRSGDKVAYASANETFHALLYAGSHNAYLSEITQQTRQRLQPFRRAQFTSLGRLAASHQEHAAVVQAVLRGDYSGALGAMVAHIVTVRDAYLSLAQPVAADRIRQAG